MNICYIISDINKAVFFEHTALLLRKHGIETDFILINSKQTSLDDFLINNGFRVNYLNVKSIKNSFKAILQCKKYLKNMDIVHCHLGTANWVGLWAAKLVGIKKRIYTRHTGEPVKYSSKEKIIDKIQNSLATDIVAISENVREILLKQHVNPNKISLIHHGFDLNRFLNPNQEEVTRIKHQYNPNQQYPVIGVIARWMEGKGIQYIISAYKKILKDYPNAKLCLFNASENGDYSKELNQLLSELPKSSFEIIEFEENVYDLYQLFDIYIHVPINASYEAFGQTYVEALAAGIPSIFTLSGIAREFINEKNAIIVAFKDENHIFEGIEKILNNEYFKSQLIQQGKKDVFKLFGLNTYIQNLIKLYRK